MDNILRTLQRASATGPDGQNAYEVIEQESGVRLKIGKASEIASVLLASRSGRRYPALTLHLSNVQVATTSEADNIAERVADSISFELHTNLGIPLMLQRLEARNVVAAARRRTRSRGVFEFPKNSYPHAPVLLYYAGLERTTGPLIRFWSFYQVLEYFFPKFSQAEALKHLSRLLRAPTFNAHREEDVLKAVNLATAAAGSWGSEADQLLTTLESITTPEEVRTIADELDLKAQLTNKSELTAKTIRLTSKDYILADLAQRIYDIRCRIVHSKSSNQREESPGLLPGTHHEDLMMTELPVMEFLAQQALVSSAEALTIPPHKQG